MSAFAVESRGAASRRGGPVSRAALADTVVGATVTAVLLGGLARPGFPLLRDWVATPTPPLSDAALGLGESAARAVPQDVAVIWATRALEAVGLPVWPLTGAVTALLCVWLAMAAGALARRVVPLARAGAGFWLRLPAVVGAVWNPFVVERLLQGHWSLLAGVASVMTMPVLLARPRPRVVGACAALAAAGLTPTGWLLAVIAATAALWGSGAERRGRAVLALAGTAVVTASPWVVATALAGRGIRSGTGVGAATGVEAFAARAEPGIGTVGSVFASGGIWNSEAVPPSRATWWAAVALVLVLAVWALAARGLWRSRREPVVRSTVPLAVLTWLLVAGAATGPGLAVLDAIVSAVPGAGLLRDTQKFVALALPATVLAMVFAARALAPSLRPAGAGLVVTAVAIASVPDAPRALWTQLRTVTYGDGWDAVARIVDGQPGDLLVLPAGTFRSTPLWADGRAVLDPTPRMLDTRVLVPGDLVVGGAGAVAGEGDRARRATQMVVRGEPPGRLADLGVRWVLDQRTSAGPRGDAHETLGGTTTRFADPELVLYELAAPIGADGSISWAEAVPEPADRADRAAVLAAHVLWLVTLGLLGLAAAAASAATRRPGPRGRR